jgi:hypothetical protein
LQRIIANNPGGIFTARIAALQAAINLMLACMTDDVTRLNIRMAMKQIKNTFRDELGGKVSKLYVGVQSFYGLNAPQLTIIFGSGRAAFKEATDDCLEPLLQTMSTQITARVADLGAPAAAEAAALLTSWQTIYGDSEVSTGDKTVSQAEKKAAREGVQLELYKNLATLMIHFPDQPDKLDLYMQQSLLEDHPAGLPLPGVPDLQLEGASLPSRAAFNISAEGATSFKVWHRLLGAPSYTLLAEDVPPGFYETPDLAAGDYEFYVEGVNATGTGPESEAASVTIA